MAVSGTLQGYKERVFEATTGKIRNKPISKKLKKVLDAAAEAAGVEVRVTSGGQAAKGTPGPRTGSTRHDLGMAADLQLVKDGRVLDFTKAADRAVFETFTSVAAANGATGIGAGVGYMGPNTIHVGFGSKSVWGPGNSSANAPGWLKTAVTNGWNGAVSVASATADLAGFDGAPGIQGSIGNRTIKPGMKGEDVRALQSMLKSMGANIPVDGDYGPLTRAAIEKFQAANGLKVDGVIGARTRPMLELATAPNNPSVSLEARDEAYQARMLANAPKLQGTAVSQTSAIPEISGTLAPVSYHSAPKRVLTAPKLGPMASAADNLAPPGIGPAQIGPSRDIDAQLQKQTEALRNGWSIKAARQMAGLDPVSVPTPRANPRYAETIGANSAFADPTVNSAPRIGPNFGATVGNASPADNLAPPGIGKETPSWSDERIARNGLTPSAVMAAAARQMAPQATLASAADNRAPPGIGPSQIAPRMVRTESIPQNVPTLSSASAKPTTDPQAMARTFDIMSNYQPSAAPKTDLSAIFDKVQAPSLPSRTVSTPQVSAVSGAPLGTTDIPASMSSGYPKLSPALTAPQAAQAARYAGLAAQYQQQALAAAPKVATPTYQATSPLATAPTLDEIAYNNGLPVQSPMAATAAPAPPPSAFQKLAPGMLSIAMASSPMGVLGGFARLAAASLGNVNNPRGLGYDAGVAARNAAVARGVQASDLVGNGASYGRRQSDGTVTGTTSRGTGYTSSNGGDKLSVGGRSYTKNKGAGYSLDL